MRYLFSLCAVLLVAVHYNATRSNIKDMEEMGKSFTSLAYALTGRNAEGQVIDSTQEPEEEETIYYLPPGVPKEEPVDMRYNA